LARHGSFSSMKTSLSGSGSRCPSNRSSRLFRTSGRSCSTAWPVFFPRHGAAPKEAPERRGRGRDATVEQMSAEFRQCDVRCFCERRVDQLGMCLDLARPHVPTPGLRRERPGRPPRVVPADRRGWRDPIPRRSGPPAQASINRRDHPFPQLHGKWFAHRCPQNLLRGQ
jgi:hypothetical protein